MKYKLLIGLVLIAVLLVLLLCIRVFLKKEVTISDLQYMRFHYTRGYAMNADVSYEINCDNGNCTAIYKPYGVSNDNAMKKSVDSEFLKKIENLFQKYEVGRWNGFNGNNKYVLDGDSFGLYVIMNDGSRVEASGYMKWPRNYSDVCNELDFIFEELFK